MEHEDSMKILIDPEDLDMEDFRTISTLTGYLRRISPEPQGAGE